MDSPSAAICRGVRAVARNRFLRRLGVVTPETMVRVEAALGLMLGIAPAPPPEVLDR